MMPAGPCSRKACTGSLRLNSPLNCGPGEEKNGGNNKLAQTLVSCFYLHLKTSLVNLESTKIQRPLHLGTSFLNISAKI